MKACHGLGSLPIAARPPGVRCPQSARPFQALGRAWLPLWHCIMQWFRVVSCIPNYTKPAYPNPLCSITSDRRYGFVYRVSTSPNPEGWVHKTHKTLSKLYLIYIIRVTTRVSCKYAYTKPTRNYTKPPNIC